MASIAEAEMGSLLLNFQEAIPIRTSLEEMNHPQPPTPVYIDNSTAYGIANRDIKQKRSKYMDMRFYWVRYRLDKNQFIVYCKPEGHNLVDYITNNFPFTHHVTMRPTYLHFPTR